MEELVIYTDGASRGNPGDAAIGVRLCAPDGTVVEEIAEPIGRATNNVAEYTALIRGLERARALGARRVRVLTDSELMVRQVGGIYTVKNEGLLPLFRAARSLLAGFERASVDHIPRERNRDADRLANLALDRRQAPEAAGTAASSPAEHPPSSRRVSVLQVDAFTRQPFAGNPAGVVLDAAGLSDGEMQEIAREINVSETAFLLPPAVGGDFRLRYFTPGQEVDLCGHATVATFFALAATGRLRPGGEAAALSTVRVETRAGLLPVEVRWAAGRPDMVVMTQAQPRFRPCAADLAEVAACLGVPLSAIDGGAVPVGIAYTGLWHLLVPVRDLAAVQGMAPDLPRLARLNEAIAVHSTHVFSFETVQPGATLHARSFAPAIGIAEDPQTGTASGALGAYLVARGAMGVVPGAAPAGLGGTIRLEMEQGHELGRPGLIAVEVELAGAGAVPAVQGEPPIAAVRVGGPAVIVLKGEMYLPAL